MKSMAIFLLFAGPVSQPLPAEFYQDFRGAQFPTPPFKKFTQGNPDDIKPEPEGLRITVPVNELPSPRAGVGPTFRVVGNFEITASFEVLQTGDQPKGGGAGAVLQILKDPKAPFPKNAVLSRVVHPKNGSVFAATLGPPAEGEKPTPTQFFPSGMKAGKLRFVRTGSRLSWQISAGPSDVFGEFRPPEEFGTQEVLVRLFADPGKGPAGTGSVDLRFLDLRIRADALPGAPNMASEPPAPLPAVPNIVSKSGSGHLWWIAVRARWWDPGPVRRRPGLPLAPPIRGTGGDRRSTECELKQRTLDMAASPLSSLIGQIEKLSRGPCEKQRTDLQLLDVFAATQDELAFAELVARHGPLVLRVCRRVLHHEQDAEDAFQATFLVLAQRHGSIQKRESLTSWLYGVAYRTAMRAKRSAARRRNHEARSQEGRPATAVSPTWDDVQAILDEEIQRLPETFRAAFVLCVLEGKTVAAAAAELHWKEGTVSSRLTRARQWLQQHLSRRGIQLPALLAALCLADSARARVPSELARSAIRLGLLGAAGGPAAGQIPPVVAALAAGVSRAMFLQKTRIAILVLLALGLFASGAGMLAQQMLPAREQPGERPKSEGRSPERQWPAAVPKDAITYSGRVLGPDNRPVAGAKLYLTKRQGYLRRPAPSAEYATTGADGRFQLTVPKADIRDWTTVVVAAAAKYGPGWVEVSADGMRDDLTLRLVEDDVPITGQVVDLEGKPIPGATLTVLQINAAPGEDLGPWLEAVNSKKGRSLDHEQKHLEKFTIALSPKVTTDAEGRLRLTGIGRNRLVRVQLDGPTIASQQFGILTRPGKTLEVREFEGLFVTGHARTFATYHGATFRHAAAPTRPVVGLVRDKDTKKPLAGVTIQSEKLANYPIHGLDIIHTTTDAQGRYRLTGLPRGKGNILKVVPAGDQPLVAIYANVPDSPGLNPVTVDCELKRGVWIEGKITDKVTGAPLQADVEYHYRWEDNPILSDYPDAALSHAGVTAKEDGSYRIVGLPGPGLVAVWHKARYLCASERDDEQGAKEPSLSSYGIDFALNYSALARVDPPKGAAVLKRDVTLDPGWTFTGIVLGPDRQPLAGARGFRGFSWDREGMKTAEFTVRTYNPRRPRDVVFQHAEKRLVGVARPPKENGGTVTVQMGPGATVAGRLVDKDGQPRPGVELAPVFGRKDDLSAWPWAEYPLGRTRTDREGRFRFEALLPGYEVGLYDRKIGVYSGGTLRSGETKDLGDVRLQRQAK